MTTSPVEADEAAEKPATRTWLSIAKALLLFAVSCLVTFQLEHYAEDVLRRGEGPAGVSQTVFGVSGAYTALVTTPQYLVTRRTLLIPIDPASDPTAAGLAGNICEQRKYVTDMLRALAALDKKPLAIVLDKDFGVGACSTYGPADPTSKLIETAAEVSKTIPVIVSVIATGQKSNVEGAAGVIAPSLVFGPTVSEGISHFPEDSNKLALGWNMFDEKTNRLRWYSSVALEAAAAVENRIFQKNPSLKGLMESGQSPYMNLIPPGRIDVLFAAELICQPGASWFKGLLPERCKRFEEVKRSNPAFTSDSPVTRDYIRGKVVVVGERGLGFDRHNTALGSIAGLELQAMAIEALLAESYFMPVPYWLNLILGFLLFALVHWSLMHPKSLICIVRLLVVLAAFTIIVGVAARVFHIYITPAAGLLAMVLKLVGWVGERLGKLGESHATVEA